MSFVTYDTVSDFCQNETLAPLGDGTLIAIYCGCVFGAILFIAILVYSIDRLRRRFKRITTIVKLKPTDTKVLKDELGRKHVS